MVMLSVPVFHCPCQGTVFFHFFLSERMSPSIWNYRPLSLQAPTFFWPQFSKEEQWEKNRARFPKKRVCPTSDVLPAPRPGEILMQVFWLNLNWICHCRAGPQSQLKFNIMQIFPSGWINFNKWTYNWKRLQGLQSLFCDILCVYFH